MLQDRQSLYCIETRNNHQPNSACSSSQNQANLPHLSHNQKTDTSHTSPTNNVDANKNARSSKMLYRMESLPAKLMTAVDKQRDTLEKRVASLSRRISVPESQVSFFPGEDGSPWQPDSLSSSCRLPLCVRQRGNHGNSLKDVSALGDSLLSLGLCHRESSLSGDDILRVISNCDNTDVLAPAIHKETAKLLESRLLFYLNQLHNVTYCYDIAEQVLFKKVIAIFTFILLSQGYLCHYFDIINCWTFLFQYRKDSLNQ